MLAHRVSVAAVAATGEEAADEAADDTDGESVDPRAAFDITEEFIIFSASSEREIFRLDVEARLLVAVVVVVVKRFKPPLSFGFVDSPNGLYVLSLLILLLLLLLLMARPMAK